MFFGNPLLTILYLEIAKKTFCCRQVSRRPGFTPRDNIMDQATKTDEATLISHFFRPVA